MRILSRAAVRIIVGTGLLILAACQPLPKPAVVAMPGYEAHFRRSQGWIGADAIYSVALKPERILWLFGDTFIGEIEAGQRRNALIVNNTVGIQVGRLGADAVITFYEGHTADSQPAAIIQPSDGRGWFWIYDGIQTVNGLYLFLVQIERSDDPTVLGFRLIGNWLARIDNPQDPPNKWRVTQKRLPWQTNPGGPSLLFGSALLAQGNQIYIYGAREREIDGRLQKEMVVARVTDDQLEAFQNWRFYADGRWTAVVREASAVCADVANEYSVSYLPKLEKYVLIYSESGLSPNILARIASRATGPWSKPIQLYRCPESDWDSRIFCYAGKGHAEVSNAPGELVVTYVSNATELEMLEADARLYRPRFLRVKFE